MISISYLTRITNSAYSFVLWNTERSSLLDWYPTGLYHMLYFTGLVSNWHLPDVLLYWICSPVGLYQMHYFTGLGIQLVFTRHTILLDWESSWSLPDALLYWIGIQLVFTICCTLLDWYPICLYQMLYFTGLIVQGFVEV